MMQQQRTSLLPNAPTAKARLRRAFWGKDSITSAFLVYLATNIVLTALFMTPLSTWLTSLLGTAPAAVILSTTLCVTPLFALTGWVTAKVAPRYCVVPWATLIPCFLMVYIFPQIYKMWHEVGGLHWLIWQLLIGFGVAILAQSWVLLSTRRRITRPLGVL